MATYKCKPTGRMKDQAFLSIPDPEEEEHEKQCGGSKGAEENGEGITAPRGGGGGRDGGLK